MGDLPIRFPPLRSVLYDQTPLDEAVLVTSSVCAPAIKVRTAVLASVLRRGKKSCVLLGKAVKNDEIPTRDNTLSVGGEWTLEVDGFDAGSGGEIPRPTDASLSLRTSRPVLIKVVTDEKAAVQDALNSWFNIQNRFRVTNALRLYAFAQPLPNQSISLKINSLAPSVGLVFRRVPSLNLLSTALLKKLSSPPIALESDKEQPLDPLYGLLTLNETRKAVLLLEDDPLAYKIPVVGVWFRGGLLPEPSLSPELIENHEENNGYLNRIARNALSDPFIYSGCIRYAANEYLSERVCPMDSPKTFLVCLLFGNTSTSLFLECSVSSLDANHILERYQSDIKVTLPTDDSTMPPPFISSLFSVPDDIIDRLHFKRTTEELLKQSEFRMEWLTPVPLPNSNILLKQIEEAIHDESELASCKNDLHVKPITQPEITKQFESLQKIVRLHSSHQKNIPTRISTRANLLVDFVAKQQQEILELRRIVEKLEQTVLGSQGSLMPITTREEAMDTSNQETQEASEEEEEANRNEMQEDTFEANDKNELYQQPLDDFEENQPRNYSRVSTNVGIEQDEYDIDEIETKYLTMLRKTTKS